MIDYTRECPKCKNAIIYSSRRNFIRGVKRAGVCFYCNLKGNKFSNGIRSDDTKQKMRIKKLGKHRPDYVKLKISNSKMGISTATDTTREILRVNRLNQIKKLGVGKMYNPKACKFIDDFGKRNGYNFQHALNGGEISVAGYSLDGYDKCKNVVFEYDEVAHHQLNKKQKDLIRQQNIINRIRPSSFIRYDERNNIIYDVVLSKNPQ